MKLSSLEVMELAFSKPALRKLQADPAGLCRTARSGVP
jgi:hypothetical protein